MRSWFQWLRTSYLTLLSEKVVFCVVKRSMLSKLGTASNRRSVSLSCQWRKSWRWIGLKEKSADSCLKVKSLSPLVSHGFCHFGCELLWIRVMVGIPCLGSNWAWLETIFHLNNSSNIIEVLEVRRLLWWQLAWSRRTITRQKSLPRVRSSCFSLSCLFMHFE